MPEETGSFDARLTVLEKTVITWQDVWKAVGVFAVIMIGILTLFYQFLIPHQIATGISESTSLNNRFGDVHEQLKTVVGKIDDLQKTVSATLHPKIVAAAIKDVTSGDKASLVKTLPTARTLLQVARKNKVPIAQKDLNEISKPLFDYYPNADATLRHELALTFGEFASTKASTDAILHPLSESEITKAKAENNYFENVEIDLSSKETWKDSIFKNCKIKVSSPDKNLILENVRFVDTEFLVVAENDTSRKLFQTVVEKEGPEITSRVAVFSVAPPVVKDTAPITK